MQTARLPVACLAFLLVVACSKITAENFGRVREGMTESEVAAILGPPTESSAISLLGITGTSSRWVGKEHVIALQFVNGKVQLKELAPLQAPKPR